MNLSQGPQFMMPTSWSNSQSSGPVAPQRLSAQGRVCAYPTPPPSAEYCTPAAYSRGIGEGKFQLLSSAYGASTKRAY